MCESKRRKNYISSHLCIFKTYRLGQSIWGRLKSGRLGCQRLRCRWLKRENNYISFKSVKKNKHTGCVQADAEGSDVGGSDVGY